MIPKNTKNENIEKDDSNQSWGVRNGPTIFGISVFVSLFLIGALMRLAS